MFAYLGYSLQVYGGFQEGFTSVFAKSILGFSRLQMAVDKLCIYRLVNVKEGMKLSKSTKWTKQTLFEINAVQRTVGSTLAMENNFQRYQTIGFAH